MRSFAALLMLTLISTTPCVNAQQDPFDPTAADVAGAIARAFGRHQDTKVLVVDFSESKRHQTGLGPDLARQFFATLQTHAQNFTLVDRDKYLQQLAADKLSPGSYVEPVSLKCYASELHAAVVVTGELDDLDDTVVLWIKVIRSTDSDLIIDKRVSLPLTPAMAQLLKQVPEMLASSNSNRATAHVSSREGVPTGGKNGYSLPACLNCPNASYSDAAVKEKIQGTVRMNLLVGADGLVEDVTIVGGLPCGLSKQAIDFVRTWKMRPAIGPNGQPAEVTNEVEMTFRLY